MQRLRLLPVYLLPVVLLVVSAIFLIVGGQLGKGLEAAAAFFYTGMICFYMVDVLMEALSIHQCQVLEWCDAISLAPTAFAQDAHLREIGSDPQARAWLFVVGRVPLGVGVLFGGAVVTFLKRYFGLFFLGAVRRTIIAGIWVAFFQRVPAIIVRTGARHEPRL